jgi:hypothetical protein
MTAPFLASTSQLATPDEFATLDAWHERSVAVARDLFAAKRDQPIIHVAMRTPDGIAEFVCPWGADEKNWHVHVMKRMLAELGASHYSLISEAWAAIYTKGDPFFDNPPAPSEMPRNQREDILFIVSHDHSDAARFTRFLVRRRGLGERVDEHDEPMKGRMFDNWLPRYWLADSAGNVRVG